MPFSRAIFFSLIFDSFIQIFPNSIGEYQSAPITNEMIAAIMAAL
jgi:hypothetical protein